jgi:hypothetical protein
VRFAFFADIDGNLSRDSPGTTACNLAEVAALRGEADSGRSSSRFISFAPRLTTSVEKRSFREKSTLRLSPSCEVAFVQDAEEAVATIAFAWPFRFQRTAETKLS